jgi:hypothetical protein
MVAGPSKGHDRNSISKKPSTAASTNTCTSKMTSTWTLTCHVLVDGLLKASKSDTSGKAAGLENCWPLKAARKAPSVSVSQSGVTIGRVAAK